MSCNLPLPIYFTEEEKEHFETVYNALLTVEEVKSIAYIGYMTHFLYLELDKPPSDLFFKVTDSLEKGPFKLEMVPVDYVYVPDGLRFYLNR